MSKMHYKEPVISKIIFSSRRTMFRVMAGKKKIIKIWHQRREYFSRGYWTTKGEKKKSTAVNACDKSLPLKQNAELHYDAGCLSCRMAVYTCIFGPYDLIREPLYRSNWCDYYIITDQEVPTKSKWKKIDPELPEGFSQWPNAVKNRFFKMHPEKVFPQYRYSLYVDGNVWLLTDMYPFVMQLKNKLIGIFKHPLNDCFYLHAPFLESLGLVSKELSEKQVKAYRKEGFPEHYGYFECTILLREHNHPRCVNLMDTWWNQYCTWVKRDQQSLMYSLWKNGMSKDDVACLGENLRKTERFILCDHKQKHSLVSNGPNIDGIN